MKKMMLIGLVLVMAFAFSVPAIYAQQQNTTPQTGGWYCPMMSQGAAQGGWYCPMMHQGQAGNGGWYCPMMNRQASAGRGCCGMMNYNQAPPATKN